MFKKKNRILTISFREIKKTFNRFFSLCVLSFLGVSFYAGMKMSYPAMVESVNKYYDDNKIYDMKISSTLGLTNDDVKAIKSLDSNFNVYGSHHKDAIFKVSDKSKAVLVEDGVLSKTNYKIGDSIKLEIDEDRVYY